MSLQIPSEKTLEPSVFVSLEKGVIGPFETFPVVISNLPLPAVVFFG